MRCACSVANRLRNKRQTKVQAAFRVLKPSKAACTFFISRISRSASQNAHAFHGTRCPASVLASVLNSRGWARDRRDCPRRLLSSKAVSRFQTAFRFICPLPCPAFWERLFLRDRRKLKHFPARIPLYWTDTILILCTYFTACVFAAQLSTHA